MQKSIKRGQVWYYKPSVPSSGSIQRGPRPVVIVSNDVLNETSSVVLGIPCTTQTKRNFPTHTLFIMNNRVSVALAEQIMPVNVDELTTLEYILEDYIMRQIDESLLSALSLNPNTVPHSYSQPEPKPVQNPVDNVDKKPIGNQVAKFYSRYPQLAPSRPSRQVKWTKEKAMQLVEDFESNASREFLEQKYGLSFATLRRYYYTYRRGI